VVGWVVKCFWADTEPFLEANEGEILAVRRGRVNFCYREWGRYRWAGVFGCVRDVLLAFVDTGSVFEVDLTKTVGAWWFLGSFEGFVADFPAPSLPGGVWSRLVARADWEKSWVDVDFEINLVTGEVLVGPTDISLSEYVVDMAYGLGPFLNLLGMRWRRNEGRGNIYDEASLKGFCDGGFDGSVLVGEVFKIVEREGDYLRLVGRGGDEFLAWDFVFGKLDSGRWVLFGEDGFYEAERRGDEVVVLRGYSDSVFDVRGPPYAPRYPVVKEVKWVKKALEKAEEAARRLGASGVWIYEAPVGPQILLRWPLADVEWNFTIQPKLIPPFGGELHERDCRRLCEMGVAEFCEEAEGLRVWL
jgi:hypothetical protein